MNTEIHPLNVKSEDWINECEWRFIGGRGGKGVKVICKSQDGVDRDIGLTKPLKDLLLIKKVTLGCRTQASDEQIVQNWVRNYKEDFAPHDHKIQIAKLKKSETAFELEEEYLYEY